MTPLAFGREPLRLRLQILCALTATAMTLGVAVPAAASRTLYVSPAGNGSGNSAANPLKAQTALDRAVDGDEIVFVDGNYPSLKLSVRDRGAGTITLRAMRPGLERIDVAGRKAVGRRASGAVIDATGSTGLSVSGHNGIVVDGLLFRGGDKQLSLLGVRNARVSRNHFQEAATIGLLISKTSDGVEASQNLFTNQRKSTGAGWYMDYGLFAEHPGSLTFTGNMVDGRFNQGVSLKQQVTEASIVDNLFRCENGTCLMLGQEGDLTGGSSLIDRTVGRVNVEGNQFVDNGYVPVGIGNVERVTIDDNRFWNSSNLIMVEYPSSTRSGMRLASGGRLPRSVSFTNNTVEDVDWMFLEGRGTSGDTVTIASNRMVTPLRRCQLKPLGHTVAGIATREPPRVVIFNTAISCVRS